MKLPIHELVTDAANVRQIDPGDLGALVSSMRALGLIQPIVVRPIHAADSPEHRWGVVAGARRLRAAQSLGWSEIEAVEAEDVIEDDDRLHLISLAENTVRAPMHPVDQWKAIARLVQTGYSIEGAADALGLDHRYARRLNLLGHLAPAVLDMLALDQELPDAHYLRTIASAPHEVQEEGIERARGVRDRADLDFPWWRVAQACERGSIPRSRARFPHEKLAWDEDLFAEPDSDEQFTTTETEAFMALQAEAIGKEAAASKGRITVCNPVRHSSAMEPPAGWKFSWDPVPKRFKKDDPRKVLKAVISTGYDIGTVVERLIEPKAAPRGNGSGNESGNGTAAAAEDGAVAERERAPITNPTLAKLAAIKDEALREGLAVMLPQWAIEGSWQDLVRVLLLAFAARNVSIRSNAPSLQERIIVNLIEADGTAKPIGPKQLADIVADVLGDVLTTDHPLGHYNQSGPAAEWIGQLVDAPERLPRFDTEEILKGCSGNYLRELARSNDYSEAGQVKEVRARLIGNLPDWRPATFSAMRNVVEEDFDSDNADDEGGPGDDA